MTNERLRQLPSVDRVLRHEGVRSLEREVPRTLLVRAAREILDEVRRAAREPDGGPPDLEDLVTRVARRAAELRRPRLRRVINATGIVVHTNLGRSLLSSRAAEAVAEAARHYVTLEYDLASGARSSRQAAVRELLAEIAGAEDALVVNNNAAAVLLALNSLSEGSEAVISRGELVEIGGSFRMPDVMAKSGARMVEVGTTNRTRIADFERALGPATGLLVKVHRSNFAIRGFTEEVPVAELAALGRPRGIPVLFDLGSGSLVDLSRARVPHETTPREALAQGAAVVTFSGDKLLGGPQAGILAGTREVIARIARNPLLRALRPDKLTLAALEATLTHYRDEGEGVYETVPTLAMICAGEEPLKERARELSRRLRAELEASASVEVVSGESEAGGGALPDVPLPTALVAVGVPGASAEALAAALRAGEVGVVARVRDDRVLFDLRTLSEADERELPALVAGAAAAARS